MGLDLTCQQVAPFRLRFCAFGRSEHRCRAINGSGSAELSNHRKLHDQSPRGIHDRSVAAFEHLVAVRGGNRPAHLTFRAHAIRAGRCGLRLGRSILYLAGVRGHKRSKVAPMWGPRAKHACPKILPASFDYHGREFVESSADHHDLILRANRAKLVAHPAIAQAFVATLPRPIGHEIPEKGAIDMRSFVT
jgi:hypothetical protein